MTFEEAMQAVKHGHAVRRAYWGRKIQDCYLLDAKAMAATDWIIADEECASWNCGSCREEIKEGAKMCPNGCDG